MAENLTVPKPSWLDVALEEKSRLEVTAAQSSKPGQQPAELARNTVTETATPTHGFAPATLAPAQVVSVAQLPALPTSSSAAAPAIKGPITSVIALASATAEPESSDSDSFIDVVIPDVFSQPAETKAVPSSGSKSGQTVAPIAKATSGAANALIQMQIGKVGQSQAAQPPASKATAGSLTNKSPAPATVVAANPVVNAVGKDAPPLVNFRLSDAPSESAGVFVPLQVQSQGATELRASNSPGHDLATKVETKTSDKLQKIPAQGTLVSTGSDTRVAIRIDAPESAAKTLSTGNQSASKKSISDQATTHTAANRPEPIVQAVRPAHHMADDEKLKARENRSFATMIVGQLESASSDQIDVQLRSFKALELDGTILECRVENESICRVMKTGNRTLSAIGLQAGSTRLAVMEESAGKRSLRIFVLRISSDEASASTLSQLAQELTRSLRSLYGTSRVEVIAVQEELSVRGVAASEEEARAILSFVRRTTLRPVIDQVVTRR